MKSNTETQTFGISQINNTIDKTKVLEKETYNKLFQEYVLYMSNLLNKKN